MAKTKLKTTDRVTTVSRTQVKNVIATSASNGQYRVKSKSPTGSKSLTKHKK